MLEAQLQGGYRYLPSTGPVPFCAAVVAEAEYEIVHATLERPIPYEAGFKLVEAHLASLGRPRQALCAVELRCTEPYTPEAFREFNGKYAALLSGWGLFVDGVGITARTNVAPDLHAPPEQVLFAFSYTVPSTGGRPTFIVSGAPPRPGVRPGDESADAAREKVADVVANLEERLTALGRGWEDTTDIGVYSPQDLGPALRTALLPRVGTAVLNGIRWFPSSAPVVGYGLELDTRGVRQELRIPAP